MSNKYADKIKRRREVLKQKKKKEDNYPPVDKKVFSFLFWTITSLIVILALLLYIALRDDSFNKWIIQIATILGVLFLFLIVVVPRVYAQTLQRYSDNSFDQQKEKLKLEDDTRKTVAQIIGGAVLLGGLVFTFNTFRLQQSTYQLQQEGQFTDRFTKAVTQIGDDKLEVRLGGLYALERIAKDSPKDHWTVMEILSAYVREKAKKKNEIVKNTESNSNTNANNKTDETKETSKIATDIQTVLTIIGRRDISQDLKKLPGFIDLGGADLRRANLQNLNFNGVMFSGSDLTKTTFFGATLNGSILIKATLFSCNFQNADLTGSILIESDLREANFQGTILDETTLHGSDLRDAKGLSFEKLQNASIDEKTKLPENLDNRKAELFEISKNKFEEMKKRLGIK